MAIEKITRAKGIIYRAVWVNPITGRRESKSFDNELDAKQHEIDRHTIREQKRTAMNAITMPPDSPAWVKRGDQCPKKALKVTHEEKNVLQ